jgi:hypothetical protein
MTRRYRSKEMIRQRWLFDAPPVSWDEIYDWVENVTGIPRDHWRATWYAEQWNVADKVARAKGYTGQRLIRQTAARHSAPDRWS